ncbi:MAG: DUF4956 domain-containing protein [Clostridiales Family XIII bacterium]|jgi:uncharacterized membrane protein HdeD (DUF308 family)|nr:DUF4956 domain-containing protein [Clostridiales Family XIII bacterium]
MFESIFNGNMTDDSGLSALKLLIALAASLVVGAGISLTYMKTHKTKTPSQGFAVTLVVLPAVVALIILLIGDSVARAFSLAGAFQIIRFRSAPGDPKDITFVLFSMAVGLCMGTGHPLYGAMAAALLCAAMFLLEAVKYGQLKTERETLKITVPENLDLQDAFDGVLARYTSDFKRVRMKTSNLGSLFELQYSVSVKPGADKKALIDELRCRNGNLNISLTLDAPQNEF